MICPYCLTGVKIESDCIIESSDVKEELGFIIEYGFCPECNGFIVSVVEGKGYRRDSNRNTIAFKTVLKQSIVYPTCRAARRIANAVPSKYVEIFNEAEQVNQISPRASATLSRYLLQRLFHEELSIRKPDLEKEIQAFSERTDVSSKLASMLQVMRKVANFAAHPKKSTNSNEIVDINKGEADIMLDLIYEVFDYVFIKPKQHEEFVSMAKEKYGIEL